MKKLSQDQITILYKFTRKHFVEHYDLQTELVDHLANGIEEQWKKDPSRSFETVLHHEFKKFGIFGFEAVIGVYQKAMEKRYWKIIFRFYKEYFRLPKIALTLVLVVSYFTILRFIPDTVRSYFFITTVLFGIVPISIRIISFRRTSASKSKKWLLEDMIFGRAGGLSIVVLPLQIMFYSDWIVTDNIGVQIGISLFIICYFMLLYVIIYDIPPKAQELLKEQYIGYKCSIEV